MVSQGLYDNHKEEYLAEKYKSLSRRGMISRDHVPVCHDNHERQQSCEDRGRKKARMEVRKPIRYIDEFHYGKSKYHSLIPVFMAQASRRSQEPFLFRDWHSAPLPFDLFPYHTRNPGALKGVVARSRRRVGP
jgi:hypothetical protein